MDNYTVLFWYFLLAGLVSATGGLNEWVGYNLDHCSISVTSYLRVKILMDVIFIFLVFVFAFSDISAIRDMSQDFDESIMLQILLLIFGAVHVLFPWVMLVLIILLPRHCSSPVPGWSQAFYWTMFGLEAIVAIMAVCYFCAVGLDDFFELVEDLRDANHRFKLYQRFLRDLKHTVDKWELYLEYLTSPLGYSDYYLSEFESEIFKQFGTYRIDTQSEKRFEETHSKCSVCLEPLLAGELLLLLLKCRHTFHWECISKLGIMAARCPICKTNFCNDHRNQIRDGHMLHPLIEELTILRMIPPSNCTQTRNRARDRIVRARRRDDQQRRRNRSADRIEVIAEEQQPVVETVEFAATRRST